MKDAFRLQRFYKEEDPEKWTKTILGIISEPPPNLAGNALNRRLAFRIWHELKSMTCLGIISLLLISLDIPKGISYHWDKLQSLGDCPENVKKCLIAIVLGSMPKVRVDGSPHGFYSWDPLSKVIQWNPLILETAEERKQHQLQIMQHHINLTTDVLQKGNEDTLMDLARALTDVAPRYMANLKNALDERDQTVLATRLQQIRL